VDGDISAEVVQTESGAMIREGRELAKLHKNVVVKCPLTRDGIKATAALINQHPDRFLFGTDEVAPTDQKQYLKVFDMYAPLFAQLTADASEKVRKQNYVRLFDEARRRVRAWERANVKPWEQGNGK